MTWVSEAGSPSVAEPDYWWYRARADLLQTVMEPHVGNARQLLDVGSADGPSVDWLRGRANRIALDMDPRGLEPGDVCGSATALPFASATFDVVVAFDVIEHCEPESVALSEIERVLVPGGRLLMSVPAYQWAWTHHDDLNHHHRRYTRKRARAAVERAGLVVRRDTYAFIGTFPFFALDRLRTRFRERNLPVPQLEADAVPPLPRVPPLTEKILMSGCRIDRGTLGRWDLPFGSSVLIVAEKPTAVGSGGGE
jgi:SAM-dependent methyltransferase